MNIHKIHGQTYISAKCKYNDPLEPQLDQLGYYRFMVLEENKGHAEVFQYDYLNDDESFVNVTPVIFSPNDFDKAVSWAKKGENFPVTHTNN